MKINEKVDSCCSEAEPPDPRVRRTRKLLQEALRGLLQEKRFAAISVQDIAERATVNRATFYAHYVDKQELAVSVLKADLHTALVKRHAEPPALNYENLVDLAVVVFEYLGNLHAACPETARELQNMVGTTLQEELYEILARWLSESSAYARLFSGCAKETVATVLSWSIYGGAARWSRAAHHPPAREVCQEIIAVIVSRVPTPA